jgi:transposase-like protein
MTAQLTDEQATNYLKGRGHRCPFCGSEQIEADAGVEVDSGIAWQRIDCHECDREWDDLYTLTGVEAPE